MFNSRGNRLIVFTWRGYCITGLQGRENFAPLELQLSFAQNENCRLLVNDPFQHRADYQVVGCV